MKEKPKITQKPFDADEFLKSNGINAVRSYFNELRRSAQWVFDEIKRSEIRFLNSVKDGDYRDAVRAVESCALMAKQFDTRSEEAVRAAVRAAIGFKLKDF